MSTKLAFASRPWQAIADAWLPAFQKLLVFDPRPLGAVLAVDVGIVSRGKA